MMHITIDDQLSPSGCLTCCCEMVALKPGETQPLFLNYAPWALPIAARGLCCEPVIDIEEKQTCPIPTGPNLPPAISTAAQVAVAVNTAVNVDLKAFITDPENDLLTFKLLPIYAAQHGKFDLKADGTGIYTPVQDYKGPDRCFVQVSDPSNTPVIFEVLFGVGVAMSTVAATPDLSIGKATIDHRLYMVTVPVIASPAARTCQVFRLSIRQGAVDCDWNNYYHVDCVDVKIAKC